MTKHFIYLVLFIFNISLLAENLSIESLYDEGLIMPEARGKVVKAKRVNDSQIKVDGIIDEEIWKKARKHGDFTMSMPDIGVEPSEKTEFRVLYSNQAMYVAIRAYDSEPDKIMGLLTRRDEFSDSDWLTIYVDSRYDRATSYNFAVNPFGVKVDFYFYNDSRIDLSWDAVWDAETHIDDLGWTAEFKIPYSALRFGERDDYIWGFNVRRIIKRKQERDYWVVKPRGASGWVSRYGLLTNIKDIKPPRRFEVLPYMVGRTTVEPGHHLGDQPGNNFQALGSDIKYGLGPGMTLDVTINPDFGQVEDDPSVLNLSVYETFFPERRPFFIEGSKMYQTPIMLFHSRRVGKKPGRFKVDDEFDEVERPDFSTILTAAKVTGKTKSGYTFSVLNAVTDNEFAVVDSIYEDELTGDEGSVRQDFLIEPMTNFFVGRLRKDISRSAAYVGMMATAVNRHHNESDYSGGIDWQLRANDNMYDFDGQLAYSVTGEDQRDVGYAGNFAARKIGGKHLKASAEVDFSSPEFDINDIGYMRRNNRIDLSSWVTLQQLDYFWIFQRMSNMFRFGHSWNYDGLVTRRFIGSRTLLALRNYWSVHMNVIRSLSDYDDLETRGGPIIRDPAGYNYSVRVASDDREAVGLGLGGSYSEYDSGTWGKGVNVSLSVKPTSFFSLSFAPNYSWGFSNSQWVKNIDDDDDGVKDHHVFGELNRKVFDIRMRTNLTLTRNVSFQVFMQPYVAFGKYEDFKDFSQAGTYNFSPYTFDDPDFDFSRRNFKSNAVFRWEYRPGSTLFFVWTQNKSDNELLADFNIERDFKRSFSSDGNNVFLLKLNYWFNI